MKENSCVEPQTGGLNGFDSRFRARLDAGDRISLFGGDFMPLRELAPAFGYCTFSWNVTYGYNLTNDTGVRTASAVYISQREVQCQALVSERSEIGRAFGFWLNVFDAFSCALMT